MNTKRIFTIAKSAGILFFCLFIFLSVSAKEPVKKEVVLEKIKQVDPYIWKIRGYLS
jgi:hypothetical protein